jgi:hypothetical protein
MMRIEYLDEIICIMQKYFQISHTYANFYI